MQQKFLWMAFIIVTHAESKAEDYSFRKYLIGSTMFMLENLLVKNRPYFIQISYGYNITEEDVIPIEIKNAWQPAIPYGKSLPASAEKPTRYTKEAGIAFAYQRFLWKRHYAGIHIMNARQTSINDNGRKIDSNIKISNTDYPVKRFLDRFLLRLFISVVNRCHQIKIPGSFKHLDDRWTKIFFGFGSAPCFSFLNPSNQ